MAMINPYRPGAGLMPGCLAGREDTIDEVTQVFDALTHGVPVQSIVYCGLCGMGKTVLLNRLESIAGDMGIYCSHIEIEERDDFISQIIACAKTYLTHVRNMDKVKNLISKTLDAITSLAVSFDPESGTFSLSVQDRALFQNGNLNQSLTQVFTALGETASKANVPICFFVDEMQYVNKKELGALIVALHRANQLGYPILVIGTGVPKLYQLLAKTKTYAERLFLYREISSLDPAQTKHAITEPAKKLNINFDSDASDEVFEITNGYPFFIQQLGKVLFDELKGSRIDKKMVDGIKPTYYDTLDSGFYKTRYERCSDSEKEFIIAMANQKKLPCEIAQISKTMKKDVKSISPHRAKLIDKGIIYSPDRGLLDFTVPEFDLYLRRLTK